MVEDERNTAVATYKVIEYNPNKRWPPKDPNKINEAIPLSVRLMIEKKKAERE